ANATAIDVRISAKSDPSFARRTIPLERDEHGVWSTTTPLLTPGTYYSLRARGPKGPTHRLSPARDLLDPYPGGLARTPDGAWRSYVQHDEFDWGGVGKPGIPLDHTVLYEAHVRGLTKQHPDIPEDLRGTYAGLAHPRTIEYLTDLGVTTIELLPVHQHVSE